MDIETIMAILEEMQVGVFATVDDEGKPHARYINIGVANEEGVFFMTNRETNFYNQLKQNDNIALASKKEDDYLIQVIRIEGKAKAIGPEQLELVLENNPYVDYVYPDKESRNNIQVFHLYQGQGFYQSLTQGHKYTFEFGQ